ncbi:uncharacterized protein LOC117297700 [Asterias rubens]|uniref:uncharacterized protein LOC117297700 n=1 Tax=Asterias rubens TaxID=7604 RepID=UPI0014559490|nr:uncharacterized protein LOC117297700 [Asterias rubens]
MDEEARWANPVHVPRPPSLKPARRFSVPSVVYSTKTDLQLDEKSGLLSNAQGDYANQLGRHVPGTGRRVLWWDDSSGRDCPAQESAYSEISAADPNEWSNQRPSLSKRFLSSDLVQSESLGKHNPSSLTRRPASSGGRTGCSRTGLDALSSPSSSPPSHSDIGLHRPRVVMQLAADAALPGARERKRPILLKQRERTPALNIDNSTVLLSSQHAPSLPLSSSPPSLPDTNPSRAENRRRRLSYAGESVSLVSSSLGSNLLISSSSARNRRKSTSVLPSISQAATPEMSLPTPSQLGPDTRRVLGAPGALQTRSLPEEGQYVPVVGENAHVLNRKKIINSNVSLEYKRVMGDLKVPAGGKQNAQMGKRLLSKRWSSLQTSILTKNPADDGGSSGDDGQESSGISHGKESPIYRVGTPDIIAGERNNNDPDKHPRSRGWIFIKDNLRSIADMSPRDSIDSKPLSFKNIADLVKAKEFRLMMKRRASFIENGRFQFEEAKQDLYRRYGRANGDGNAAASEKNQRKPEGTKVINRRKLGGISGSI